MKAELKNTIVKQLQKAKGHLEYSCRKVKAMPLANELSEEQLETLESFSIRFARFSDLIVSKYFRVLTLEKDPAFRGSVIDLLSMAEKFGWVSDAKTWIRIRELRNVAAHEYEINDYKKLYAELIDLAPQLLNVLWIYEVLQEGKSSDKSGCRRTGSGREGLSGAGDEGHCGSRRTAAESGGQGVVRSGAFQVPWGRFCGGDLGG